MCDNGGHYIGQKIHVSYFTPWCEFIGTHGERQVLGIKCCDSEGTEYYIPTQSIRMITKEKGE